MATKKSILGILALAICLVAFGAASAATIHSNILLWDAPDTTIDNTAMDPYEELHHYELYVSETGNFLEEDTPAGIVLAVEDIQTADGTTFKRLITEFNLLLLEGIPSAQQLYVSLRAVGNDGQKSDFMEPVIWTRS